MNIRCKPWKNAAKPRKVLAIRLQALGDTIITLPYLQSIKRQHPELILHFLTRDEVAPVPQSLDIFDKVVTIGGGRNAKLQFILVMFKLPWLWWQRYDVVLDLQHNKISVILRKLLNVKAWTEFDKYSPISAGERTRKTIEAVQVWNVSLDTKLKTKFDAKELLLKNGRQHDHKLVVLNPAGFSPSRSWPLSNYVDFAKYWLSEIDPATQFVLLLLPALKHKADYIESALGNKCINLTGKSNQVEAFAVLSESSFVLSEDSGLMHMAWVQGIPTLALFSSSRKDWSAPQGSSSMCLDSSDMECGPCMQEVCKYGDNRCLTRYTPQFVADMTKKLIYK